jgi:hypothetical protein
MTFMAQRFKVRLMMMTPHTVSLSGARNNMVDFKPVVVTAVQQANPRP